MGRYTSSQTPVYEFKTPVYEFAETGIRVRRHRETSSHTKCMGSIRFRRHRYTSSRHRYTSSQTPVYEFKTPVYEFADTGSASSLAILGDLKVRIEKSKNMGVLKNPL